MTQAVFYKNNPTIADTVRFLISCPDTEGCYPQTSSTNTYQVQTVTVYFVERDYVNINEYEYPLVITNSAAQDSADTAQQIACETPTDQNIQVASQLSQQATASETITPFYFNSVTPVEIFGSADFPAWLISDTTNSILTPFVDDNGNTYYGKFILDWQVNGNAREGDYFICWTYAPLPGNTLLSAHEPFVLHGNTTLTTAIPTHFTVPGKYEMLLDKYLPTVFKMYQNSADLTPEVLQKFNAAVAKGFTGLEDFGNQIIDLLDANVLAEPILTYLSNLFYLKLRSTDPTRWRKQIKQAVPLFKKKGTLSGLQEALGLAGIRLTSLTRLWQVVPKYTYTEQFFVQPNQTEFELTYVALPYDSSNFSLTILPNGESNFVTLDQTYVSFLTSGNITTMTWVSNSRSLSAGDLIVLMYKIGNVPNGSAQTLENYCNSLPLADLREPLITSNGTTYPIIPLKNWNVHLLEEDDPVFDLMIPERHPFEDDTIFGIVKTEFVYSENLFNKDEYNTSTRFSTDPCDIDSSFLDDCGGCVSSKFNLELEIDDISDDRIKEVNDILEDYLPFHAKVQTINLVGRIDEFLEPPVEYLDTLLSYSDSDFVIAGNANAFFTRCRLNGYDPNSIRRNMLATQSTVVNSVVGIGSNQEIVLYSGLVDFTKIGLDVANNLLEVLSPSPNSGKYFNLSNPLNGYASVTGVIEPVNCSPFTFRLSNIIYFNPYVNVYQDNFVTFSCNSNDFILAGVKTVWDVSNTSGYSGGAWKLLLSSYSATSFTIKDVLPDGTLLLEDPSTVLPIGINSNVVYSLYDDNNNLIATRTDLGVLTVTNRGRLEISDDSIPNVNELFEIGNYVSLPNLSNQQYSILSFVGGETTGLYLQAYAAGNAGGQPVTVYDRLLDNQYGSFNYKGMQLDALVNLEENLGIVNGSNPPATIVDNNLFKENFLVQIGDSYYQIAGINENILSIVGPFVDWTTSSNGGTSLIFSVLQFTKTDITIDSQEFSYIDRSGNDMVTVDTVNQVSAMSVSALEASAFNFFNGNEVSDVVDHSEGVSFRIDYLDGDSQEGEV